MEFYHTLIVTILLVVMIVTGMVLGAEDNKPQDDYMPHFTHLSPELEPEPVKTAMTAVADWQIANPGKHNMMDWTYGALFAGMSAWSQISDSDKYTEYLRSVSQDNDWQLYFRTYHADDHCVGQMYLEMYARFEKPYMIEPTQWVLDWVKAHPPKAVLQFRTPYCQDRWSWCDSLFMSPPVWARLGAITGNMDYYAYMDKEWWATTDYLYDKDEHLYYRDSRYFDQREKNGKKVFWGRGNGWVFGGLTRVIDYLPEDYPSRPKYIKLYKEMAQKLLSIQQSDGLWRPSLLDPGTYTIPETSGSGFYTYGLAWGINRGFLDREETLPAVQKAWEGLLRCVHPNGKLGWVQRIAGSPGPSSKDETEVYGVGAFLLTGSEMYKLAVTKQPGVKIEVANPGRTALLNKTVEVDLAALTQANDAIDVDCTVFSIKHGIFLVSQVLAMDGKTTLLFQANFAPGEKQTFVVYPKSAGYAAPEPTERTFGRFVPERMDDFAWESDRIAFRMYGPALEKTGEISSGVDVWSKSVRYPVVDKRYKLNDYHNEHGDGLDFYKVGPTLGCGGTAVCVKRKLYCSKNYTDWKVLANGPIRTVFELRYAPWKTPEGTVTEVKRIAIDLGSNLNRFESTYTVEGGNGKLPIAIGIVLRGDKGALRTDAARGWMTYREPANPKYGTTSCGAALLPGANASATRADGNAVLITDVTPGEPLVYYAGACWDKSGDFTTPGAWNDYVGNAAARATAQLTVDIK
ncbi:MAG: DUF4861 family protein [Sedimentisphaerales bacterium]|nr:DUF4861 family protein [Sedimentisphaerales bacterium]